MNRMWEIRERDERGGYGRIGMRHNEDEIEKAYECGFEDGYEKAMKELRNSYGERRMRY